MTTKVRREAAGRMAGAPVFRVLTGALLVLGLVACGGSDDGGGNTGGFDLIQDIGYGQDANRPDTSGPEDSWVKPDGDPGPDVVYEGTGALEFVDRSGANGVSCVGTNRCPKEYTSVEIHSLPVRYLLDGVRMPNVALEYTITRGPESIANIEPGNGIAVTDENGEAAVNLRVRDVAQEEGLAQLEVTVRVPSREDVPPVYFDILIDVKGPDQPPLTVLPDYVGAQPVESVRIRLFRQPADPRNPGQYLTIGLTCEDLIAFVRNDDEGHMPTADLLSSERELGQSYAFQEVHFSNLETDPEQMYTIVAVGQDANRVNRIIGCDDERGLVRFGESVTVVVPMMDLPPRLKGVYEVRSEFDLISALPDDVENIVNIILNFFNSPSETILGLLCLIENDVANDLCGYVFTDSGQPNTTGTIIIGVLDGIIRGLGEGNWFGTTLGVGADIGMMLKKLTFLSVVTFDEEPDTTGWIDPRTTEEDWRAIRYRWTLGIPNCAADPSCGWNEFSFSAVSLGQVVRGEFSASVNTAQVGNSAPYTLLTIDEHPLNIRYGELLNYIIKKIVLPRLAGGEPPDGLPVVDEYDELIKSVLAGRECLEDELFGGPTCCETFTENILGETDIPMADTLIIAACGALVEFGSTYIEDLLLNLDLQTGGTDDPNAFLVGTMPGAPCQLYDGNNDLEIDSLGRADRPCQWQAKIRVSIGGGLEVLVDANFWGSRQ